MPGWWQDTGCEFSGRGSWTDGVGIEDVSLPVSGSGSHLLLVGPEDRVVKGRLHKAKLGSFGVLLATLNSILMNHQEPPEIIADEA